jgi:hypothetical protein
VGSELASLTDSIPPTTSPAEIQARVAKRHADDDLMSLLQSRSGRLMAGLLIVREPVTRHRSDRLGPLALNGVARVLHHREAARARQPGTADPAARQSRAWGMQSAAGRPCCRTGRSSPGCASPRPRARPDPASRAAPPAARGRYAGPGGGSSDDKARQLNELAGLFVAGVRNQLYLLLTAEA